VKVLKLIVGYQRRSWEWREKRDKTWKRLGRKGTGGEVW